MLKEVDLLSYWMPVLRQLKEFRELAEAEEPELRYLLEATERTLNGMFIDTADEYSIKRFEEMLGIIPETDDTLSMRRSRILTRWNNKEVYTTKSLHELLTSYCGAGNFEIIERYNEYVLEIIASLPVRGSLETVHSFLTEIIPCNLILTLQNVITEVSTPNLYVGGTVSTAMLYSIPCEEEGEQTRITSEIPLHSATAGSVGVMATVHTIRVE